MIKVTGQQMKQAQALPNFPPSCDPLVMGGRHLREEGRSTSAELRRAHVQHSVIHFLPDLHNWGSVAIMPRSFYRYVAGSPEAGKGHWEAVPPTDTKIELDVATRVAEAALEFDGKRLYRLWQRLGMG